MIYLSNAGTSWPKPEQVQKAIDGFCYHQPPTWERANENALDVVTEFLHIPNKERFLFTNGCTSAIALAMQDFDWRKGDRLIISHMEHHALSRWHHKLPLECEIESVVIPRTSHGPFDLDVYESELKKGVRLVAITMASNVTGEILSFKQILDLAHQYGALCMLDGAQTTGVIPINIAELEPDIFVFAGHKGPMGPQGIGGLYVSENVPMICPSAVCEIIPGAMQHMIMPSYCDTGSLNTMAAVGLTEGLKWIMDKTWDDLLTTRWLLMNELVSGLSEISGITQLGHAKIEDKTGAVALDFTDKNPGIVANQLEEQFQIQCGSGFQCAPMAHEALGTDREGCLRISVSPFTTANEIHSLIKAIKVIMRR